MDRERERKRERGSWPAADFLFFLLPSLSYVTVGVVV